MLIDFQYYGMGARKSSQGYFKSGSSSENLYLPSIFDTHPLETWSILDISQGLAPEWASSMIFCRVESGKGRPFT